MNDYTTIDLEKHETMNISDHHINGTLTVIWRDWDKKIKHEPKMIYVSSVNPMRLKVHIFIREEIVILYAFMEKFFL